MRADKSTRARQQAVLIRMRSFPLQGNKKAPSLIKIKDRTYACGATLLDFCNQKSALPGAVTPVRPITWGKRRNYLPMPCFRSALRRPFVSPLSAALPPPAALFGTGMPFYFFITGFNIIFGCILDYLMTCGHEITAMCCLRRHGHKIEARRLEETACADITIAPRLLYHPVRICQPQLLCPGTENS